jgi:hypothetical protein
MKEGRMRYRRACLLVLAASPAIAVAADVDQTTPSTTCPTTVTAEPFDQPSKPPSWRFWYGTDALAVLLKTDGTWQGMGSQRRYRDKLFWWRQGYDGRVEQGPALAVTGRRIDGAAPPAQVSRTTNAYHSDFGGWAMLVAVEFPTSGCWELTGEYHGHTLTFVVSVGP